MSSLKGARVAIQGFGNAGRHAATIFRDAGAVIVGVSDTRGSALAPKGLDVERIAAHKDSTGSVVGAPGTESKDPLAVLEADCELLIPAAMENQITMENAGRIKAPLLAEAANGPTTPGPTSSLRTAGSRSFPDILANAGGVVVSYFEWAQNLQNEQWDEDRVDDGLRKHMYRSTDAVVAKLAEITKDLGTYQGAGRRCLRGRHRCARLIFGWRQRWSPWHAPRRLRWPAASGRELARPADRSSKPWRSRGRRPASSARSIDSVSLRPRLTPYPTEWFGFPLAHPVAHPREVDQVGVDTEHEITDRLAGEVGSGDALADVTPRRDHRTVDGDRWSPIARNRQWTTPLGVKLDSGEHGKQIDQGVAEKPKGAGVEIETGLDRRAVVIGRPPTPERHAAVGGALSIDDQMTPVREGLPLPQADGIPRRSRQRCRRHHERVHRDHPAPLLGELGAIGLDRLDHPGGPDHPPRSPHPPSTMRPGVSS